ncbi:LOW QUALITY PROTEIN: craniofacial development protein 1-like [Neophocaena asiaeorientalis asiaeorientalis]|uniref:Craniofacial development protein 1 n=1 Tax=Neophocaena asiaeorientalis asiaeorientalis TaxID=1706337 RepID=A0A341B2D2_NEOAA|nr:LOW QUALITY PROTEIN: craniofacial development protein 1-like [Neophocaena asiaeorientalis asiaeorientalis]
MGVAWSTVEQQKNVERDVLLQAIFLHLLDKVVEKPVLEKGLCNPDFGYSPASSTLKICSGKYAPSSIISQSTLRGLPQLPPALPHLCLWFLPRALPLGVAAAALSAPRLSDLEEFDSEDFSTSEEDEDYVSLGGEYSEDDVNDLVKEHEVDGEEKTQKTKGRKRKAQSILARKRKQGGLSLEKDKKDASEESGGSSSEEEDVAAEQEKGIESEDTRKKMEDELWASFLNDVGLKSKVPPCTQVKRGEEAEETSSSKLLVKAEELEKPKETEKVKITKVFDFAGEVRVTKEVDATSKEAKSFFKQNAKEKPQANNVPSTLPSLPAGSGLKRSRGMNSLLGKIGAKKQKMSILEKAELDWESFKEEECIGEELAIHNRGKEGFIERKAFLDRVDHRQFEIERDLRLSKMKP